MVTASYNNSKNIKVPSGSTTGTASSYTTALDARLAELSSQTTAAYNAATSASQAAGTTPFVNQLTWSTTQTTATGVTRNTNLATDINNIVSAIGTINSSVSNINDSKQIRVPSGTTTSTTYTTTLESRLIQIQQDINSVSSTAAAASTVYVQNVTWSGTTPTAYTGVTRSTNLGTDINNIASAVGTINSIINDPANIRVKTNSTNTATTTLTARLDSLETVNPNNITINGTTLTQWISDLQAAATIPNFLLFATNSIEIGIIPNQEFLVHQNSKLVEVAIYTNPDATIGGNITVAIEQCVSTTSTYNSTALTTCTMGTSSSGKLAIVDLTSSPISINKNTRLRANITAAASGTIAELLSVRVKLIPNT